MQRPFILLVEDEPDVRNFFARALTRIAPGVEVHAVENGLLALEFLRETTPDLIISDHRMPQMTGLELLKAVRDHWDVPFFLISADPLVQPQALQAGASLFLPKPIALAQLRAAVAQFLRLP